MFEAPIQITGTATLRAAVVAPGLLALPPATTTWLFLDDILVQPYSTPPPGWPASRAVNNKLMIYGMQQAIVTGDNERLRQGMKDIPSMSLVTDLDHLFAPGTGTYSHSNQSYGSSWNRPASVELIDPQGDPDSEFQIDIDLRLRGAWSRMVDNPKNSFRFFFRSAHGDRDLEFPLFGEEGPSSFKKVDLRTAQNYSWSMAKDDPAKNTFMRDVFSRDTQRDMGMPHTRSRFYHLYINGHYWGLYQTQERGDNDWAETYLGGSSDDWDNIKTGQPGYVTTASDGNNDAWHALHAMTVNEGFSGAFADNYWRVRGLDPDGTPNPDHPAYVDQDNLIDYMLVSHYTGDNDGPVGVGGTPNNINALFNRENPTGFIWLRHDAEHSLGARNGVNYDTTALGTTDTAQHRFNPALLHWKLAEHPEYRMRIADRVQQHVFGNGALTPANATARVQSRMAQIDFAIIAESARWRRNTNYTRTTWLNACNYILNNYLNQRRDIFVGQYRNRGWFPSIDAPLATFENGVLRVSAATPFHYLLDDGDPRLVGGAIAPAAIHVNTPDTGGTYRVEIPLHAARTLRARARSASEWSALTEVELADGLPEGMLIHGWDFESVSNYLSPSHTFGGGSLEVVAGPATDVYRNAAAQGFASAHLRIDNPLGAEVTFQVPTTGFEQIELSYDTRRSGRGAGIQTLHTTTDGTTWEVFTSTPVDDANPQSHRHILSGIPGSGDNPDFAVRITFLTGAGGTTGNNRFDDVRLTGVPLPGVNLPPTIAEPPGLQRLVEQGDAQFLPLEGIFVDPDGDTLTYSVTSDNTAVAAAAIIGNTTIELTPGTRGRARITLTASDGHRPPVATHFRVLVHPAAHRLADAAYGFGHWSPDEPAGAYPPHMLFLQGDRDDAWLNTPLDEAYHIPAHDAADAGDVGLPYAAGSRTRINGLGADGIAFINTGRGRDLGGALLAVDTRDISDANVRWTGGTVLPNSRVYAIRLQYRVGHEGPFRDLKDAEGLPSEYLRHPTEEGHARAMDLVALPADAMGHPHVQLLWRYYRVAGDSGPRAQLRLDDVLLLGDHAEESVFMPPGDGDWNLADNWSTPYVPSGSGVGARIGAPDGHDRDVSLQGSVTLGRLAMHNAAGPHRNRVRSAKAGETFLWARTGEPAELIVEGDGDGFTEFRIEGGTVLQSPLVLVVPQQANAGEYGALRLREGWSGPGGLIKRGPGRATLTGSDKNFTGHVAIEQGVLAVTQPATPHHTAGITVQPGGQLRLVSGYGPDVPAVYTFGGVLELDSPGRSGVGEDEGLGVLGALRYEPDAPDNHAIINSPIALTGPSSLHVAHADNRMTLAAEVSGHAPLSKSGGGTLILEAPGAYTGPITIDTGSLRVQADWRAADVLLGADTQLEGFGRVGHVAGAGRVQPGPGATLLTAETLADGVQARFTLGRTGSPHYGSPSASGNALLRLTDSPPFPAPLTAATTLAFFLTQGEPTAETVFRGGIFTDADADFHALIEQADIRLHVPDPEGEIEHEGVHYRAYDGPLTPVADTAAAHASFPDGAVYGRVQRIWFAEGGEPIEPQLALAEHSAAFQFSPGDLQPAPQRITINNAGGGTLGAIRAAVVGDPAAWLTVHRGGHGNAQVVTLTAQPDGLPAGTHTAVVSVTCANATNPEETIAVSLTVTVEPNRAALPYQQHWEAFTPGTSISGQEGWHSESPDSAQIELGTYDYPHAFPPLSPPAPGHTRHLEISGAEALSHTFLSAAYTNVVIDAMIRMIPADQENPSLPVLEDPTMQIAYYANHDGHLVLWHQDLLTPINRLTVLNPGPDLIQANTWARITVEVDYRSCPLGHHFFRIALHGQPYLVDAQGLTQPDMTTGEPGGPWFLCANQGRNNRFLRSLTLHGSGAIDDYRVAAEGWIPVPHPFIDTVGNGICDDWERAHFGIIGIDPHADPDGDGMTNLEEFLAGTDPNDPDSVLEITGIESGDGLTSLRWNSRQTDTVPRRSYRVRAAGSPTIPRTGWSVLQEDIPPQGAETTFEDVATDTEANRFYRIEMNPGP